MQKWEGILVLSDMDGTLLPASKVISKADLAAIQAFRAEGGQFTIATGRTWQAAQRYLAQLQIDVPVILFNGAAIYDPIQGEMLYTQALPEKSVEITQQVLDVFPDVSAEIIRADATYVARMTAYEEEHLQICQVEPILCTVDEVPKCDWLKVLFAIAPERMDALQAYFRAQHWTCADFVQSEARFYEMLPKGATKGSALKKYRQLYPGDLCAVVAAGDFDNDLEMLREADYSACPSNAQPCVRETVDVVLAHSCEESAVSELLQRIEEIMGGSKNG